jgi:hypothetical protein
VASLELDRTRRERSATDAADGARVMLRRSEDSAAQATARANGYEQEARTMAVRIEEGANEARALRSARAELGMALCIDPYR